MISCNYKLKIIPSGQFQIPHTQGQLAAEPPEILDEKNRGPQGGLALWWFALPHAHVSAQALHFPLASDLCHNDCRQLLLPLFLTFMHWTKIL